MTWMTQTIGSHFSPCPCQQALIEELMDIRGVQEETAEQMARDVERCGECTS